MSNIFRFLFKSPVFLSLAILLGSCGSGSNGGFVFIAPAGLGGLIFTLSSTASFEFISDAGSSANGMETGAVRYMKNGATNDTFIDNNGNTLTFTWPEQIAFGRYEYTRVGDSSGEIKFFGVSSGVVAPDVDLFGGMTETTPSIFAIIFQDNASFLGPLQMTLTIPGAGPLVYTGEFAGSVRLLNGAPAPIGYDPSEDSAGPQPSRITDGMFDGDFLTLTDNATMVELSFIFVASRSTIINGRDEPIPTTETGKTTVTDDMQMLGVSEADYVLKQPLGTDDVIFELSYTGTTVPPLPANVTYTLTFTSLEAGTYVGSDASTGTFTFFPTGDR